MVGTSSSLFVNILIQKAFPAKQVFACLYQPLLREIQFTVGVPRLVTSVEAEFTKLASTSAPSRFTALAQCGDLKQFRAPGSCFGCLARVPSNTLTCNHRLCDSCLRINGNPNSLTKCPLCGIINEVHFHLKPPAAGVRILRLGGEIHDTREIAALLNTLRSKLFGPVYHYFDIVFCSGVGIFFAVMMLC